MSMPNLKESIRDLLHLQATLPRSLTNEISVRNLDLVDLHDQFVDMASEFRIWSFYETRESMLSGSAAGFASEVQFGAPLVSVKSALLEVWIEDVYAVDADHYHLASFGPNNERIMDSYLADFAQAIEKAARLNLAYRHTPLHLKSRVNVEVIGFYEDPDAMVGSPRQLQGTETGSIIRLYSTKHPFKDFLKKGPDRCLTERLDRGPKKRLSQRGVGSYPEAESSGKQSKAEDTGLGLPRRTESASQSPATAFSPEIVVTSPLERPPLLRVPAQSEPSFRPSSPESNASSVSTTVSDSALPFTRDFAEDNTHTIDVLAHHQAKLLMKEHGFTAGFSRPSPSSKKFTWVHMPFNNPVWVKVGLFPKFLYALSTLTISDRRSFRLWQEPRGWISRGFLTMTTGCPSRSKTAIRIRNRRTSRQRASISRLQTAWLRRGSRRLYLAPSPSAWASRPTVFTSTFRIFTSTRTRA
jgi:hypothetical protein